MPMTTEELAAQIYDFKTAFTKSDAGIKSLEAIAKFCLENQNPYVAGSFDQTAKNCGKQSVILFIRRLLSADGLPMQEKAITDETESEEV